MDDFKKEFVMDTQKLKIDLKPTEGKVDQSFFLLSFAFFG